MSIAAGSLFQEGYTMMVQKLLFRIADWIRDKETSGGWVPQKHKCNEK